MSSFHGILAGCLIVYDMGNELIATTSDGHCNCDLSRLSPKIYDFSLRSLVVSEKTSYLCIVDSDKTMVMNRPTPEDYPTEVRRMPFTRWQGISMTPAS